MPEISVILPFYNAEKTLKYSVKSILNQNFTDFELLLINNNSKDKSFEIAEKIEKSDSRIKLLHERKQGVVFASRKGFNHAISDFIARADADDIWHPNKLNLQYKFLKNHPETDVIACRVKYIGKAENKGMITYVEETNKYLTHSEIALNRFSELQAINPTILFRRTIAEKFGFYKEGHFPEDYEMFLRWLENGVKYSKLSEILLEWYDSETRLTRTDKRYSFDAFYRIKSKYLFRFLEKNNPFFPEIVVWGAGKLSKKRVKYLENKGVKINYFIDVDKKKINDETIISYENIPKPGKVFIVSFVNNRGIRDKIRDFLLSTNYIEGKNFILA